MKLAVYTCSLPEYSIEESAALIKEMGYDGCLSVEDFSNEKPTRQKLEENIEYLKVLIAAAKA